MHRGDAFDARHFRENHDLYSRQAIEIRRCFSRNISMLYQCQHAASNA